MMMSAGKSSANGTRPIRLGRRTGASMLRPNTIDTIMSTVTVRPSLFIRGGSVTDSVGGLLVTMHCRDY